MKAKLAVSAVLILLALGSGLLSQDKKLNEDPNTRSVEGAVTDAAGKPVEGAVVQLKDLKTLQIRSFYTTQDGAYHFSGLSTNVDYELRAEHNGASSGTKTLSNFDNRKTATINLKLK
jgi:Carboxypeptidase regulatory-like domain